MLWAWRIVSHEERSERCGTFRTNLFPACNFNSLWEYSQTETTIEKAFSAQERHGRIRGLV